MDKFVILPIGVLYPSNCVEVILSENNTLFIRNETHYLSFENWPPPVLDCIWGIIKNDNSLKVALGQKSSCKDDIIKLFCKKILTKVDNKKQR